MAKQEQLKTLEQIQQEQTKTITNACKLVDKFGNVNKGMAPELDTQITKLRKLISKGGQLEEINNTIDAAFNGITNVENKQLTLFRTLHETMLAAGKELQQTKGLADRVRRELRQQVNKLSSDSVVTIIDLLPIAIKLFDIFNAAKNGSPSESSVKSHVTASADDSSAEVRNTVKLLLLGLEKLSQNDVVVPKLHNNIEKIYAAKTPKAQLELCLRSFEQVIQQFSDEYKQTQKLIISINGALHEVHQVLTQSIANSKRYDAELAELNKRINEQIQELTKNAGEASTVVQLQDIIDNKLQLITAAIKQRDSIEQKRAEVLETSLNFMEQRLTQMEERSEFYRNRWLEEKARSETDALTNLPNRGAYDKRINEEIVRWQRKPLPITVAVVDIDHFKRINDTYGHNVGDKTLQVVASSIAKSLRTGDYIARYGGEEFVVIMFDTSIEDSKKPLEKLRKNIAAIPFSIKSDRLQITISTGATELKAGDTGISVFERADTALYRAKQSGRNQIQYQLD